MSSQRKNIEPRQEVIIPTGISAAQQDYQETLVKDKKSQGKDINLIALTEIGHAEPVKMPQTRLLELVKECGL